LYTHFLFGPTPLCKDLHNVNRHQIPVSRFMEVLFSQGWSRICTCDNPNMADWWEGTAGAAAGVLMENVKQTPNLKDGTRTVKIKGGSKCRFPT
jgi:hypothetical protein